MLVIGAGYMGGMMSQGRGGGMIGAALGGATTAAMVAGIVEISPAAVGGHWENPMEVKITNMASMSIVGAAAGLAGSVLSVAAY